VTVMGPPWSDRFFRVFWGFGAKCLAVMSWMVLKKVMDAASGSVDERKS